MAFDQTTRNRLQRLVGDARKLLTGEFVRQMQNEYGMDPVTGSVSAVEVLHLDDSRLETARILRNTLDHYRTASAEADEKTLLEQIAREQAFTILNRFAALKMAEARGIVIESIGSGYESRAFQLYHNVAGAGLGDTGETFKAFLFSIFDEFAIDLKVLFDRFSPTGLLFPKETVMLELLAIVNDPEINLLWAEDETIGWIYQYFNTKEERKKMRDESAAPRNSRELAVRNQFFTPRYVVEFLTDNTLGRTWYEMTRGETSLAETCRYLVRRPNEVFLDQDENPPELDDEQSENLSQEELLKQTVFIPHRAVKDPREILMLDPACGSMHFGLYAFDLFLKIYEEAWDLSVSPTLTGGFKPLRETYDNDKERFLLDVPRLIIENNVHGVDIDPRAVQIAGLSLWLRAQRAWAEQNVRAADRPQIRRSNIVCAEPMPGEADLLEEFIAKHFAETAEKRLLGEFVRRIFESMKLAGEAGSLLKIEEEVDGLIFESREQWQKLHEKAEEKPVLFDYAPVDPQQSLDFQVGEITDANFWDRAESEIYKALRRYSDEGQNGVGFGRRLFADDAAQGFAFIDLLRKKFDIVLMNPPFGDVTKISKPYLDSTYLVSKYDCYAMFVSRWLDKLNKNGSLGAITNKTGFFLQTFERWRQEISTGFNHLTTAIDLGYGVLDTAMVGTMAYTISKRDQTRDEPTLFIGLTMESDKNLALESALSRVFAAVSPQKVWLKKISAFESIPSRPMCYWAGRNFISLFDVFESFAPSFGHIYQGIATGDNFRFLRSRWEVPFEELEANNWVTYAKGGTSTLWLSDFALVALWKDDGREMKANAQQCYGSASRTIKNEQVFFKSGLTYTQVTNKGFFARVLPENSIFDMKGPSVLVHDHDKYQALGVFCSFPFRTLAKLVTDGRQWHPTTMMRLPFPMFESSIARELRQTVKAIVEASQVKISSDETASVFLHPFLLAVNSNDSHRQAAVDEIVSRGFDTQLSDFHELDQILDAVVVVPDDEGEEESQEEERNPQADLISYSFGCAFGRWNVGFAIGEQMTQDLPDPFSAAHVCPPGMLQNESRLPANFGDLPPDYPLQPAWKGILVDDVGNANDIESHVHEVLRLIGKDRAEAIEEEACETLGVSSLRDYFRKPSGFFADHLKRYSKSRRQAPIYLPLSTSSGDYTVWLYYHRLTDQTLFSCINDFVEPKIRQVKDDLNGLGSKIGRSSDDEKRMDQLTDLSFELEELRDELLRLAPIWKPNLNDGVQITMSPLWTLFRLPKWRKTLEDTWKKMEKGDYDWAHLAYSLYPDRVREKCKRDKSLAIAHELEHIFEPPPSGKKTKGKKSVADQKELGLT